MKRKYFTLIFILTIACLIGCNKSKTVILSKFANGNPQKIIELTFPVTQDSFGLLKYFFEDGTLKSLGHVQKSEPVGEWSYYFQSGKLLAKTFYSHGVENGDLIKYTEDGEWYKVHKVNGKRNGEFIEYYFDHFDSIYCYIYGSFKNDLKEGIWSRKNTTGVLLAQATYVNGQRIGILSNYFKNGKIKFRGEENKDGKWINSKFFDRNGVEIKVLKTNTTLIRLI
jgi:antitoxin component YwqK of YwqJK toxin-antitoxin module